MTVTPSVPSLCAGVRPVSFCCTSYDCCTICPVSLCWLSVLFCCTTMTVAPFNPFFYVSCPSCFVAPAMTVAPPIPFLCACCPFCFVATVLLSITLCCTVQCCTIQPGISFHQSAFGPHPVAPLILFLAPILLHQPFYRLPAPLFLAFSLPQCSTYP